MIKDNDARKASESKPQPSLLTQCHSSHPEFSYFLFSGLCFLKPYMHKVVPFQILTISHSSFRHEILSDGGLGG